MLKTTKDEVLKIVMNQIDSGSTDKIFTAAFLTHNWLVAAKCS